MYLLLVIVIGLHQVYATLKMKEDRWPLRGIALRAIEFFGRVFFLPFVMIYPIYFVQSIIVQRSVHCADIVVHGNICLEL